MPFSLRLFVLVCAISIVVVLGYAVAKQLQMGHHYEAVNLPIIIGAFFALSYRIINICRTPG